MFSIDLCVGVNDLVVMWLLLWWLSVDVLSMLCCSNSNQGRSVFIKAGAVSGHLFVVHLQGRDVFPGLGELALLHSFRNIPGKSTRVRNSMNKSPKKPVKQRQPLGQSRSVIHYKVSYFSKNLFIEGIP